MEWRRITLTACLLGVGGFAKAAPPAIDHLTATAVSFGQAVPIHVDASDADGNLSNIMVSVSGPGISGWQTLQSTAATGATAQLDVLWSSAPGYGVYTTRASVSDGTSTVTSDLTFDILADTTVIRPFTFSSQTWMLERVGQIATTQNDTATSVVVQSTANVILWSGGRIDLKPGFKATAGSFFWAAIDHNMNGYSDMEEVTDTDKDGIPDAWEVDHGLNPIDPTDGSKLAIDQSGMTNYQEYQLGRDPSNKGDDAGMPSNMQVVLSLPSGSYYGVTSSWTLTGVSAP